MITITLKEYSASNDITSCRIAPLTKQSGLPEALAVFLAGQERVFDYAEATLLHYDGGQGLRRALAIGLDKKGRLLTADELRAVGGELVRQLKKQKLLCAICEGAPFAAATEKDADALQALFEGMLLGDYAFNRYKTKAETEAAIEIVFELEAKQLTAAHNALEQATIIASAVNWARDLTNTPGNDLTPSIMAEQAKTRLAGGPVSVSVLDEQELNAKKMGGILAVGQGSKNPPALIVLNYQGNPAAQETLALVGKGVTFDSGGLSIKPADNMGAMKGDMAGGAAVLGALDAIGRLGLPLNVIGIVPCAENMPSGDAFRPGDVVTAFDGTTIEILNTDAEGRLLLADAISYARQLGATRIVDIATLTGACMVALGKVAAGVVSNEQQLAEQVLAASGACGEKMWQFPAYDEYAEMLKSPLADLKNTGGRWGGAITAGMFLKHFAGTLPWVHIDIAGLELSDKQAGYNGKGATGFGTRSLIQLAKGLSSC